MFASGTTGYVKPTGGCFCLKLVRVKCDCTYLHECKPKQQEEGKEEEEEEEQEQEQKATPKLKPTISASLLNMTGQEGVYTFRGQLAEGKPAEGKEEEVTGASSFQLVELVDGRVLVGKRTASSDSPTSPASPACGGTASTRCPNSVPPVARLTRKEKKNVQEKKKGEKQKGRREEESNRRTRDYEVELQRQKGAGLVKGGKVVQKAPWPPGVADSTALKLWSKSPRKNSNDSLYD
jgi:hypothetical protein